MNTEVHLRQADHYVPPRYPVDEPPTWRAACSCGWVGSERYGPHLTGGVDLPGIDHTAHAADEEARKGA